MEFRFNVNEIFKQPIVEVGPTLIPQGFKGDRRTLWDAVGKVTDVVNAMGTASAAAQGLTKPITSADRLRNSENQQLYLLIDPSAFNGKGAVTGLLKTGQKGLYVFDRDGHHYHVQSPCVLDFYVHESRQRSGYGKTLFEHMLQKEGVVPEKLAIDRPSEKFLEFLKKHYDLQSPIRQMNNYVVYDGFFPDIKDTDQQQLPTNNNSTSPNKNMRGSNGLQQQIVTSPYGRYGAPRPACSMGQIIHNQSAAVSPQEPTGLNIRVEEPRSFHRGRSLANATSKQESGENRQEKLSSVCSKVATVGNGLGDNGQIPIVREQQQTQQQKQEYYWPFAKPTQEYLGIDKQKLKEKPCCDTIHELISLQCTHKQPEKPQKIPIDDRGHPIREKPIRHRAKTAHVLNSTLHSSSKRLQSNDLLGDVDKELIKMNTFNKKWTEPQPHAQEEENYIIESEQKPVSTPTIVKPQQPHSQTTHQHSTNHTHPQYYYHNGQYYMYQPQQHHQGYIHHPHHSSPTNASSIPEMPEQKVCDVNQEYLEQQQQMQQQQIQQQQQLQQQQLKQQQVQQQQMQQQQIQQQPHQMQQQQIQQQQMQQQQIQQQQMQQQRLQQRQYQEQQMQLQEQQRKEQGNKKQQQKNDYFYQSQPYLNQTQPQLLVAQQSSVYSNSPKDNNHDSIGFVQQNGRIETVEKPNIVEEIGQGEICNQRVTDTISKVETVDTNQVVINHEEAMANRQHALSSQQAFPNQQVYSTSQLEQTLPCQQLPYSNNQTVHVHQRQTYPQSYMNPQVTTAQPHNVYTGQQQLVSNSQVPLTQQLPNAQMFYNQQSNPQQVIHNQQIPQHENASSFKAVSSQKLPQKSTSKSQIFINPAAPQQNYFTTSNLVQPQAQYMENVIQNESVQQETETAPQQMASNQQEQSQIIQQTMPGQIDNQIESSQHVTNEVLPKDQQSVQPKTLSGLQEVDESFVNLNSMHAPQMIAATPQNMTIRPQYPQKIMNQQVYIPQTQNISQTFTNDSMHPTPSQHLANIQTCQQQMSCNPQTQQMCTNPQQQQQSYDYQYSNFQSQPQNINYYQPQMQSTATLNVQENPQMPQNAYYYQKPQANPQPVQQIPVTMKEPLEPLIPAVPPPKNYDPPKVPQIRAQKIVCPPDNSQMLISSTTRPKESRMMQNAGHDERIEKRNMPISVNPLQRNISSAMSRKKAVGSFVDKSIIIETCGSHKSKLDLPNATGDMQPISPKY